MVIMMVCLGCGCREGKGCVAGVPLSRGHWAVAVAGGIAAAVVVVLLLVMWWCCVGRAVL
jgi:hypothetical protein